MLAETWLVILQWCTAQTPADRCWLCPDEVFLSNGPGDPGPCDYAVAAIKTFIMRRVPIFGICLGHQLLAQAVGARVVQNEPWSPWCESSGAGLAQRAGNDYVAESWLCC